jgi:hypothetical protein
MKTERMSSKERMIRSAVIGKIKEALDLIRIGSPKNYVKRYEAIKKFTNNSHAKCGNGQLVKIFRANDSG